jgi:hypothetical protein
MGLNDIQLNGSMLAGFYANTLVETEMLPAEAVKEKAPKKKGAGQTAVAGSGFLGSNGKKIAIVVSHEGIPFLPQTELSFLTAILAACKLTLADIAIMNSNGLPEADIQERIRNLEARQVILFGKEPLAIGLPIHFPPFQLQQFDGRTYLHCATLTEIERHKPLKGSLWGSLKGMFGL